MSEEAQHFRAAFLQVSPEFDPKRADKDILNSIFAWVWHCDKYNALRLDYGKGLWLYGTLGRGKSLTLEALRRYLINLAVRHRDKRNQDWRLGTYWKTASELANAYASKGQTALEDYYQPSCCLFIDELGREPNPANNFGTKLNVLQFLLQMRYDHRWQSVTHVTTNLLPEDVARCYGDYVADRCIEMFNFIEYRGESLRK